MRQCLSIQLVCSCVAVVAIGTVVLPACSRKAPPAGAVVTTSPVAASASAPPAASAPAPEPVVVADPAPSGKPPGEVLGPPRQVVEGDGISITEQSNGRVLLKTTSLWNDPIEVLYQSCEFYRDAIPVLARQLSPERTKLLGRVCRGWGGVVTKAPAAKAP